MWVVESQEEGENINQKVINECAFVLAFMCVSERVSESSH
jgi:hypothetical protein